MKLSDKENQVGQYYTPDSLAQYVVWSAFRQYLQNLLPEDQRLKNLTYSTEWSIFTDIISDRESSVLKQIKNVKILDLGVGNGAFLLAAGKFLELILSKGGSRGPNQIRQTILRENLFGVDFSSQVVNSCRKNVILWISEAGEKLKEDMRGVVDNHIRVGNVLIGEIFTGENNSQIEESEFEGRKPFHWQKEFDSVFSSKDPGFNIILCNPPYVTKKISAKDVRIYRQLYKNEIFINRFNLYHLFFARVNELLASGGITAFLTANSVLTDNYSTKIRNYLFSYFTIQLIVDFVSRTQIFPDVLQGTCILVMRKRNGENLNDHHTQIIRTFDIPSLVRGESVEGWRSTPRLILFKKIIPSPYRKTLEILEFLNTSCVPLKKLCKIQSGEIRPADKKIRPYYFKTLPKNANYADFEIVLNGKNISPYLINIHENRQKPRWYLNPREKEDRIFRQEHAHTPRIVFQRITAREQLRRIIGGKIDQLHLNTHKRIWVENNANYFLLDSTLIKKFVSADALLGIFNSLLINWYLHQINLTAAIPPSDLGLIPIPKELPNKIFNSLDKNVSTLQTLLKQFSSSSEILTNLCPICNSKGEINDLRSSIDDLVFELYCLSDIDQKEIDNELIKHHSYFNSH
ncbi:MAG: N-6 DNA methylase [Candidatus Heimdallarchaeota archaeon]|nr:MAG: N-6 DNA methylase [Candidatus Heimdallarchaeota archaeon]